MLVVALLCFFFFKQKTAYEMRISDWSSDVCSSDLLDLTIDEFQHDLDERLALARHASGGLARLQPEPQAEQHAQRQRHGDREIGRASCRERVCQCVDLGGSGIIKKKKTKKITTTVKRERK